MMIERYFIAFTGLFFMIGSGEIGAQNNSLLFDGVTQTVRIPAGDSSTIRDSFSIECWIKVKDANIYKNKKQTIVSQKKHSSFNDFRDVNVWEAFDATKEAKINELFGFVGAVYDGRYIYFSPWLKSDTIIGNSTKNSGKILRYDTHGKYSETSSWQVYDAENEFGDGNIRGLEGAVFDGRYIYFVPLHHELIYFSKILRYDTYSDFADSNSWIVYNAEQEDGADSLKGFVGAVYDGTFIYFIPNPFSPHRTVLRYNTTVDFMNTTSWDIFDLSSIDSSNVIKGFFGGLFDGVYLYFVPFESDGYLVRYNTNLSFNDPASWEQFDIKTIMPPGSPTKFTGAVLQGNYFYMPAYYGGNIARFDIRKNFSDASSWSIVNLSAQGFGGSIGPVSDGRYIYFPPILDASLQQSGKIFVFDSKLGFQDTNSWAVFNWALENPKLKGYEGSVFDGQYVYFVPMNFQESHGKIVRFNTAAHDFFSFELTYSNTSSSFGSVTNGLSFKIQTISGLRSITLPREYSIKDSLWHHIACTYDGTELKLLIDGILRKSEKFDIPSAVYFRPAELFIGSDANLENGFEGSVDEVRIWTATLSESCIKSNMRKCYTGKEDSLAAYWRFNEGSGILALDLSQNRDTGMLVNNPKWTVQGLPSPVILSPSDNSLCAKQPLALSWTSVPGAWGYNIQLATDSLFSNLVVNTSQEYDTTFSMDTLSYFMDYYWQVNSAIAGCSGDWAEINRFQVIETPSVSLPRDTLCNNDPPFLITGAYPPGGRWIGNSIDSSGSYTPDPSFTGMQTVGYVVSQNNCTDSVFKTFIVKSAPVVYAGIDRDYCENDSTVLLTGFSPPGGSWYGLGVTTSGNFTPSPLLVGDVELIYEAVNNGCRNEDTVLAIVRPIPFVFAGQDMDVCQSDSSIKLIGFFPAGGKWSGNGIDTNGIFDPRLSGLGKQDIRYLVTVNGCSNTDSMMVTVNQNPIVSAGPDVEVCAGEAPFLLNGFFPAGGYWTGNGVSPLGLFTPDSSSPGNYLLKYFVTENGCNSHADKIITVNKLPATPYILLVGENNLYAGGDGNEYRWVINGVVSTVYKSQLIHDAFSGTYSVQIIDDHGCASPFSNEYVYYIPALEEKNIAVYPNPTDGDFILELKKRTGEIVIEITDISGKIVYQSEKISSEFARIPFDLPLSAGLYIVSASFDGYVYKEKLIVH